MGERNDGLRIYSEEVRDVLSDPPKAMLKWGNTFLLAFIIILFLLSWYIKYPDIVSAQIVITTNIPPEKVVAKTDGKIETILVQDKAIVLENTPLAIIQNTANYKDVFLLKKLLETHVNGANFDFRQLENVQLGDIESAYAGFHTAYIANELNSDLQPYRVEEYAQTSESVQITARLAILQQQKKLNESELLLQKSDVNRYETLFDKGVISAQDFENKNWSIFRRRKVIEVY